MTFSEPKVSIISGFLGAGKTTLINNLLREYQDDGRTVVIENEYGEVTVDAEILENTDIAITELTSGCICCSSSGDFSNTLNTIVGWSHPDRILIEPSGIAKLSDIVRNVSGAECKDEIEIEPLVTVVDAGKCRMYMDNFGEFYLDQIQNADRIMLSKTSGMDENQVEEIISAIRQHNEASEIVCS